jgi:magnesium-transporting ATPase (P-type)
MSPAQLLWINLLMDCFAALALSYEKYDGEGVPKSGPNIIKWQQLIWEALYQIIVILLFIKN